MQMPKKYSLVAIFLIGVSVLVAALTGIGTSASALTVLSPLFISNPQHSGLTDIFQGQIWRLVTPIFIHFGPMHIIFNSLWVWDLSRFIEARKGVWFYLGFILVLAIVSNLAQYLITGNPFFGGLSGVVYGLLGYLWMQGLYDPSASFALTRNTVISMLGWYVLCWTGLLGPIANWAHTAGLVVGVAWGFISSKMAARAPAR
jgi:membrane associated rhomboid family serine protease